MQRWTGRLCCTRQPVGTLAAVLLASAVHLEFERTWPEQQACVLSQAQPLLVPRPDACQTPRCCLPAAGLHAPSSAADHWTQQLHGSLPVCACAGAAVAISLAVTACRALREEQLHLHCCAQAPRPLHTCKQTRLEPEFLPCCSAASTGHTCRALSCCAAIRQASDDPSPPTHCVNRCWLQQHDTHSSLTSKRMGSLRV